MNDEIKKYLSDILTSAEAIDIHLGEKKNFNEYLNNFTVRRAVERELEIIGEAMQRILKIQPGIAISKARLIIDLRNKVIHAYDVVDDAIIWKIISKDIPVLKAEVEKLLE